MEVIGRSEFATSYTPYQPEVSQGTLQSIYEFQSLICELTGMEVASASHYDGATATAEAALMACRLTRRDRIAISTAVAPQVRAVLATYCSGRASRSWRSRPTWPRAAAASPRSRRPRGCWTTSVACLVAQQPNFFGGLEPMRELGDAAHAVGAQLVAVVEPTSLACWRRPASTAPTSWPPRDSRLGIPLAFGGPYVGLMAARMASVRQMPGRLVGATRDAQGRKGYVLTLQAREQHIRREKAASNICTNQALCALAATAYLTAVGPHGLREVAELSAVAGPPRGHGHRARRPGRAALQRAVFRRGRGPHARTPLAATPRSPSRGSWRAICSAATSPSWRTPCCWRPPS